MEVLFAGLTLIVYIIYCCIKLKDIPVSVSQTVKALKYDWVWTIIMWAIGILVGIKMLELIPDGWQIIPFGYIVSQLIVGAAPWTRDKDNMIHNIFGILTCIFSQIWVGLINPYALLLWIPYLLVFIFDKNRWCFWSEVISVSTVLISMLY